MMENAGASEIGRKRNGRDWWLGDRQFLDIDSRLLPSGVRQPFSKRIEKRQRASCTGRAVILAERLYALYVLYAVGKDQGVGE